LTSGKATDGGLQTDLGIWWDLKPTKEFSKFSLALCSFPFFGTGFREGGLGSPCDSYLSCMGIWLSGERHAEFVVLNAGQLEHGDHHVRVDVEMNVGTN